MNAKEPSPPPKPPFRVHDVVGTAHEDTAIQPATRQAIETLGYRITNPPGKHSSLLGEGGYSVVHYAVRTDGNRPVAIKVFRDDSRPCVDSWQTERKTMEGASFPRDFVPVCLDARHFDGLQPFLVIEYVRGTEINEFVGANKTPLASRVSLLEQLASGIHRLNHDNNLIHRDISAANALVGDKGDVRLIDFGLAGDIVKRGNTTIAALGNPTYSPPEVQQGTKRADVKDEVYNCAMVALHVLTDTVPPENSVRSGDPEHLQRCRNRLHEKQIPRALASVVLHGLQDESRRFTTPGAFRDALHDWRVIRPQRQRRRAQLALLVTVLCSIAAVGWWLYFDLAHAAELSEYAELQRQAEQLSAENDAVRDLLSKADSQNQQWNDQQRNRDPSAAATRAEATRLYRRAIAVSAGLEQAQPQREALAIPLNEIPWVASNVIGRRKGELDARYATIGNDLTAGNVEQAKSALDSLQRDLAELIADNTRAGQALAAQTALQRLQRGVAERLRNEPSYAPLAQIGEEARAAWNDGQWADATRLYGLAHDQLTAWLPTQETPEESLQRAQANEETVRLVEEEKNKLQSQLAVVKTERDKYDARIRELEFQITQVTKQGADDRDGLMQAKTRADDLAAKNRAGSALLAELRQTIQQQTPQIAELSELKGKFQALTDDRDELKRKLATLESQLATLQTLVDLGSDAASSARARAASTSGTGLKQSGGETAGERVLLKVKDVDLPLRWCPTGSFMMGSPSNEEGRSSDEEQVSVTLGGFWIAETECTQQLWFAVMGSSPRPDRGQGPTHPVYYVYHGECETFCKKLQTLLTSSHSVPAGWTLQLPSESQWEYACRAGSTTRFHFGGSESQLDEYAWYNKNSSLSTHPVGTKKPNAWGIHDMSGNVWEWCADWYDAKLPGGSDPVGPSSALFRVFRGGSWFFSGGECRSARRSKFAPSFGDSFIGFRPVLSSVGAK